MATMHCHYLTSLLLATLYYYGDSFTVPPITGPAFCVTILCSTTNPDYAVETEQAIQQQRNAADIRIDIAEIFPMPESTDQVAPLTSEDFVSRQERQLAKLLEKDQTSKQLSKEDLVTLYEDQDIVVVDKPCGVLTVSGKEPNVNIAQTVFDATDVELPTADHMVVHRLGMETSGLLVLAKTKTAVRGMNTEFRTRNVKRIYEALVVGHMAKNEGLISLPVMRDYEFPPYVRISTIDHQKALLDLDPDIVGKKILEAPKSSITKYQVVSREDFHGYPVTRVTLTSISGRYHQLNVHMAAFGHPIVGDNVYGYKGEALSNGGLTDEELEELVPNPNRADEYLQAAVAKVADGMTPCVHAKYLGFRHPVSRNNVQFSTASPF